MEIQGYKVSIVTDNLAIPAQSNEFKITIEGYGLRFDLTALRSDGTCHGTWEHVESEVE